jgi:hypothetical protein
MEISESRQIISNSHKFTLSDEIKNPTPMNTIYVCPGLVLHDDTTYQINAILTLFVKKTNDDSFIMKHMRILSAICKTYQTGIKYNINVLLQDDNMDLYIPDESISIDSYENELCIKIKPILKCNSINMMCNLSVIST